MNHRTVAGNPVGQRTKRAATRRSAQARRQTEILSTSPAPRPDLLRLPVVVSGSVPPAAPDRQDTTASTPLTATGPADQRGFWDRAIQEQLALTAWCPPPAAEPDSVTVTFTGRLLKARERDTGPSGVTSNDSFAIDKTFARTGRNGPIAVTLRVRDVTPGEWVVGARLHETSSPTGNRGRAQPRRSKTTRPVPVCGWSPRRRPPEPTHEGRTRTHLPPLSLAAGVMPGVWMLTAVAGTLLGLLVQQLLVSGLRPRPSGTLGVSLAAIGAAVVGAKAWFLFLHRRQPRFDGWAVQGFIGGYLIVAVAMLIGNGSPPGPYFDTAAAGLFSGLAVGRIGCFFAGCCSGRPTSSRWGLWSSNQTIGTRRIPTQLMESALAAAIATGSALAVAVAGPHEGWVFVAAVGAYTTLRQAVLARRDEARQSRMGPRAVAAAASAVTVAAAVAGALL